MIAIAVLLVVILATSQIFGTASQVTGTGHALTSVLQEAAVIEKRLRQDFSRLSPDGIFVIRQVAVPNNINIGTTGRLLNPALPADAWVRADQLVFFADGVESQQTLRVSDGTNVKGQGMSARVYYGHGFQLPAGEPYEILPGTNQGQSHDPMNDVFPWHAGDVEMGYTYFSTTGQASGSIFNFTPSDPINGTQPEARRWVFVRHIAVLADDDMAATDDNSKTVYLGQNLSARSIFRVTPAAAHPVFGWTNELRNGRVDGAASRLDNVKRWITMDGNTPRTWAQQQGIISAEAVYYPRVERVAPSAHRVDQALTNHALGSAVSSFIVEWTWEDGVGEVLDEHGDPLWLGFYTDSANASEFRPEQPWFGLNLPDRGVGMYGDDTGPNSYQQRANYQMAQTIIPANIEWTGTEAGGVEIYEAIFGYNRNKPTARTAATSFDDEPHEQHGYTPWPSAVRITMVLHDPQGRLEHGREFQFVIDLPKRVRQ